MVGKTSQSAKSREAKKEEMKLKTKGKRDKSNHSGNNSYASDEALLRNKPQVIAQKEIRTIFSKNILHIVTFIYFFIIALVSLLASPSSSGPTDPKTPPFHDLFLPVNRIFIKFGWAISFFPAFTLQSYCAIRAYQQLNYSISWITFPFVRSVSFFLYWAILTQKFMGNYFGYIADRWGSCTNTILLTRMACNEMGHVWRPVDISGHVFLITLNTTFILYESYQFLLFDRSVSKMKHPFMRFLACVIAVAEGLLLCLYHVQLIRTILYYHTALECILGLVFGLFPWYILYL